MIAICIVPTLSAKRIDCLYIKHRNTAPINHNVVFFAFLSFHMGDRGFAFWAGWVGCPGRKKQKACKAEKPLHVSRKVFIQYMCAQHGKEVKEGLYYEDSVVPKLRCTHRRKLPGV